MKLRAVLLMLVLASLLVATCVAPPPPPPPMAKRESSETDGVKRNVEGDGKSAKRQYDPGSFGNPVAPYGL
jgi:hypothetical protein